VEQCAFLLFFELCGFGVALDSRLCSHHVGVWINVECLLFLIGLVRKQELIDLASCLHSTLAYRFSVGNSLCVVEG
jgi:hypothetical protein